MGFLDQLGNFNKPDYLNGEPRFFLHLPSQGRMQRFAELNLAARQAPFVLPRRIGTANEEDFAAVVPDDAAHPDDDAFPR